MRALLTVFALFFFACEEEANKVEFRTEPVPGQIVIFNSSGIPFAAEESRDALRASGFDVLSATTDPLWTNYEETIVAIRNPHWAGSRQLKERLDTKNFLDLQDALSGSVCATIYLGRDYKRVLGIRRGQS